jgi:hypothetical protein
MITLPSNAIETILANINAIITDIMPFAIIIIGIMMGLFMIQQIIIAFRDGDIKWKP